VMEVRDRIISILLDLTISAYVLLALSLIVRTILDSRKQYRPRSIRSTRQSRVDSDYYAVFRERGWLNRWLPAKSEMNLPAGPRNIKAARSLQTQPNDRL
jgi:hypothetical protein